MRIYTDTPTTRDEALVTLIECAKELVEAHGDKSDPSYNECEKAQCRWCELVITSIDILEKQP